jgi:uncharacterized protein (DUF427 family)
VGARTVENAAWRYPESPLDALRDLVRFEWDALDEWLGEDEPVYVHPRDPYKRVDVLASTRHVEVMVKGVKVAPAASTPSTKCAGRSARGGPLEWRNHEYERTAR